MTVLVTGATGSVGSALMEAMRERGMPARAALRNDCWSRGYADCIVVGNIDDATDWNDALADVKQVVHLASRVHIMNEVVQDPLSEYRRMNAQASRWLGQQAAANGVERFIYISTIKVNCEQTTDTPVCADVKPAPSDPYGISKHEAEVALEEIAQGSDMDLTIIRPTLVYGPGVKGNFIKMMDSIKCGVPLPLGAIQNKRSLVGIDNLVDLIITCVDHAAAANQTFLVSDDEDVSTTELMRRLGAALGKPARLFPVPTSLLELAARLTGKHDVAQRLLGNLQVDISKTKQILNWIPPVSVDEGLKKTADWYLGQR